MKPRPANRLRRPFSRQLLWWVVAASAIAVPLFYSPAGHDGFRLPKELLLRASAIAILAALATMAILDGPRALLARLPRGKVAWVAGGIAAWTLITTAFSTNRLVSWPAVIYTATLLAFFVGAYVAIGDRGAKPLLVVALCGAIPNALLAILQRTAIWNPFHLDPGNALLTAHLRTTALLGNANDVGSYLLPVAVATAIWALVTRRAGWWAAAGVVVAGLMASEALSAIGGFFAGCIAVMLLIPRRGKTLRWTAIALLVIAAAGIVTVGRQRFATIGVAIHEADYPTLTSQRIFPIAIAWDMFTQRPLTGQGPGTFKYHYLEYRMRFNERHPQWIFAGNENYAQAHCDHLQLLAEEGILGYALFAAALWLIARCARKGPQEETRGGFARVAALPLATSFAVLALGAFPLELAAPSQTMLYFAAAILRWSDDDEGA